MTSHDVVGRLRRVFGQRRIGHAGTLDPDATGVLVLALGSATRLLRWAGGRDKAYRGEVVLGVATATLDSSGEPTGRWDMASVTVEDARRAAAGLTGPILQVPPMVSAVKVDGKRLHQLARAGVEVERAPRPVTVERYDVESLLLDGDDPVLQVEVECSSGTYVRVLADDLGRALGGGAHLRNLRRTRVGPWTVEAAVPLDRVTSGDVRPPVALLEGVASVRVAPDLVDLVAHGRVLPVSQLVVGDDAGRAGPWAVLDDSGALLAVYEAHGPDRVKPAVVLAAAR